MPHTKDGKPVEVLLNPSGVPGRMNVGQVFETVASKIALKTGKPYIAEGFSKDSMLDHIKADLKKHNLSDTEELTDPQTGLPLGAALVGTQHMLKLTHQVDKKESVRSGMSPGETYARTTLIPTGGAKIGGQSIGPYGLFSLLSHGAKANIREMQTWKSEGEDPQTNPNKRWQSQHAEVWSAIQAGHMLPTPKSTFSFRRFEDMLRAAGVNVEKKGNAIQLMPLTNDQILKMSAGEVRAPHRLTYAKLDKDTGELKAYPGGLFDEKTTGGIGGKKWSHIKLPEPIPNPVFEGPIQRILGLKQKEYSELINGESAVSLDGRIVPIDTPGSLAGGKAFHHLLERVDVPKALASAKAELGKLDVKTGYSESGKQQVQQKVDQLVKKVKYLRALDQLGLKASDAYMLHNVPVIPPIMRQPSLLQDGAVRWEDLNGLYQQLGQITSELPHIIGKLPDKDLKTYRANVYDCVSAIQGLGSPTKDSKAQGILETIKGVSAPKHGYFQKQLLNRKQDLTARSTVVPEPSLGLDEVGIPKHQALKLYQPFVVNKLRESGMARDVLEARRLAEDASPLAFRALETVVRERPVIMKRDPALHLHSVQAFTPRLVAGKAIQVHPLVTSGYNMDFDGDQVSLYVPIHADAVQEARKMMPSNNLFNVATGRVTYTPTLEAALGLYKMSRIGQDTKQVFEQPGDAIRAVQAGKLGMIDRATIAGVHTTPGRVLLASALPQAMRNKILTDHNYVIDGKGLPKLFTELAKNHQEDYAEIADRLKDIGNGASSGAVAINNPAHQGLEAIRAAGNPKHKEWVPIPVHTLSLRDFEPDAAVRTKHLNLARGEIADTKKLKLAPEEKDARAIESYLRASERMASEHMDSMKANPTNLAIMAQAGVKPSPGQYQQLVLAPMILDDAAGRPVKTPVTNSYSEGLDVMGYWTQMHGARSGTIKKVGEVRDPGYFSKQLMQTSMGMVVAGQDCGTTRGLAIPVMDHTIHDRILAAPFKSKQLELPAGTLITPDIADQMRAANHNGSALVRSTLKCEHSTGVCQKCAGISHSGRMHEVGDNIGIQAAQSVGERAVQLMLKQFHTGGVRSAGGAQFLSHLDRAKQLTLLPENIPDAATLAQRSGRIEKIENDATGMQVWVGGKAHHVGKDRNGHSLGKVLDGLGGGGWQPPKVGMEIEAGTPLSDPTRSYINPHDLYRATGNMERVQNFLVSELHNIYKDQGVRRQHIEAIVGAMGQLSKVRDSGDSDLIKGDFGNAARIRALNKELLKAGKRPIEHSPVLKGINTLPHQLQEDWMARMMHDRLEGTILNAAATNGITNLHGLHPIPGAVYGAEFGLTNKHSTKPGLGHLKGVADHSY
jgi:DNA-directed RNA polymerase subunit beta'